MMLVVVLTLDRSGTPMAIRVISVYVKVFIYKCLLFRDVNLPLFGGIPLLFFAFRLFRNHFPLFLEKSPTKKKKKEADVRRQHCREMVLALSSSESKFESTVSPLGTRNLTPATMRGLPEEGEGEGGGQLARWTREGVGGSK